jgi:hypothetical protein
MPVQDGRKGRASWSSEIMFLAITVGPWLVLMWLLWSRR